MKNADPKPAGKLELVTRVVEALAPDRFDSTAIARVAAWCDLVEETNTRIDLTAARSVDELVDLMVADAVVLASRLPERASIVDVGSGAGAPGLPIALLRPDLDVTLVEPLDKRVTFLRSAIGRVATTSPGLKIPAVVRGRGESLVGKRRFGVAISRATLAPDAWCELGLSLATDTWVLLARVDLARETVAERVDYVWPLTSAERKAMRVVRG